MSHYYFEIATALFECLLVHFFFNAWFGIRNCGQKKALLFMAVFFLLQCSITLLPLFPPLRAAISYLIVLGITAALYKTNKPSAVYGAFLYMALAVVSEYLCLVLLSSISFDANELMTAGNARAIYLALAKMVHFVVVLIAASVLRKNRAALTLKQVTPLIPCLIVSIYICIVFFRLFPDYQESLSLTLVIALIGILYINGIIVLNTQSIKSAVLENEEQRLAKQHYEMQEQYYRNVLKDREETHALWHDLKKHITAIEALVDSRDNQQAKNEYDQIRQAFDELGHVVDTENTALNAILHHNISQAKSNNISVSINARVSSGIHISAVDLSVIIGNTFDNAIEECVTFAEANPQIKVTLVQQNQMLFYEITNPCIQVPHKKSGRYRGYGLGNVMRCVEKYSGSMEHGMADGVYRVSIRLNCSGTV